MPAGVEQTGTARESTPSRRKERARVYTRGIWDMNEVSPNLAGAMCCFPVQTISAARHRQARAWVDIRMAMRIGIDTSYHQVLRVQCSAPRIASLQRPPVLLNTDKGATKPNQASHAAKQVERHHFYCLQIAARNAHILFDFFDFFDFLTFRFWIPRQAIHQY